MRNLSITFGIVAAGLFACGDGPTAQTSSDTSVSQAARGGNGGGGGGKGGKPGGGCDYACCVETCSITHNACLQVAWTTCLQTYCSQEEHDAMVAQCDADLTSCLDQC